MPSPDGRTKVEEIKKNAIDSSEQVVLEVYSRQVPVYAVYQTAERVSVEYADDELLEQSQRLVIARLNPLRSSINALIDGWNTKKPNEYLARRVQKYNRRVADALILAFEEDVGTAELLLRETKDDILAERKGTARIYYIISAVSTFCVSFVIIYLLTMLNKAGTYALGWPGVTYFMWVGAEAGAFGALFSITTGIQQKDVLPDTQWVNNAVDAVLRVTIGLVAGAVIISFLKSDMVTLSVGNLKSDNFYYSFLGGFLAGFSERLIPDLLWKALNNADPNGQAKGGAALAAAQNLNAPRPVMQPPNPGAPDQVDPAAKGGEQQAADAPAGQMPVGTLDGAPEADKQPAEPVQEGVAEAAPAAQNDVK
jgi:hypothetical protein